MTIERVNSLDTSVNKIFNLNSMILELEGLLSQGKFDINEITELISVLGIDRKYQRNTGIGNTSSTYTGWSHVHAESGYSIWKFAPTNYTYNSVNNLYLDDVKLENKGQATAESATTFDKAYLYDGDVSGGSYTDNTTEAGTEDGTEFALMTSANDYLYIGDDTTFEGIKFEFKTRGSNYTLVVEYYDEDSGAGWTALTANDNDLEDNTSNFESDGSITFTAPDDWGTVSVNSQTKYWIRISTTTTPVTDAEAYYIIPSSSVIGLLALSSTQAIDEDWAWCSYGSYIYVTIRNSGNTAYEGDFYITSSSSSANKENYFVHNHEFTADYEDSSYSGSFALDAGSVSFTSSGMSSDNVEDAIVEAYNNSGGVDTTYTTSFTDGDLSSSILTVNHSLTSTYPHVTVYDNNNKQVTPDEITYVDTNSITIDFTSYGTLTGTYNVRVSI